MNLVIDYQEAKELAHDWAWLDATISRLRFFAQNFDDVFGDICAELDDDFIVDQTSLAVSFSELLGIRMSAAWKIVEDYFILPLEDEDEGIPGLMVKGFLDGVHEVIKELGI